MLRKFAILLLLLCPVFGQAQSRENVGILNGSRNPAQFQWFQKPSGSLSVGANTVTLTPCPRGISGTANGLLNAQTWVYVTSAGGDAQQPGEPVLITGGTCLSAASTGTVTFSSAYAHASGYGIGTGTAGIKEAFNDANTVRPVGNFPQNADVHLATTFVYSIKAPLFITSSSGRLWGSGTIECEVNFSCINLGSTIGITGFATANNVFAHGNASSFLDISLDGFYIRPSGAQGTAVPSGNMFKVAPSAPSTIAAGAGATTLTIPTCPANFWPLIPYQVLWLSGTNNGMGSASYEIGFPGPGDFVQITGGTCTPGAVNGTIIVTQVTPGASGLSAHGSGYTLSTGAVPLIEDNSQGAVINNLSTSGWVSNVGYGSVIQNDNNQAEYINNFYGYGGTPRCDNDFCGANIFGPGPSSINAGITHLVGGSMSQCAIWYNGNDFWIDGTVCQGYSNAAIFLSNKRGGSLVRAAIHSVHIERGNLSNSLGGAGAAAIIDQGYSLSVDGNGSPVAPFPVFLCGGVACPNASPQEYFLSIMNTTDNSKTPPIPLGTAYATNPNANPVTVLFYAPDAVSGKTIRLELYRLLTASTGSVDGRVPTPALCDGVGSDGTCLVATAIDPSTICDIHGLCTYTDSLTTPTAVTPYTGIDGIGVGAGFFNAYQSFAPGGVVLEASATYQGDPTCFTLIAPWMNNFISVNNTFTPPAGCLGSGGVYNATLYGTFGNNANTYPQYGFLLPDRNKLNDGGKYTSLKGRLNFLGGGSYPRDVTTWVDSNPAKTMGTKQEYGTGNVGTDYGTKNRPLWDVGDTAMGVEKDGFSIYNRVPTGGCHYWYVNTLPSTSTTGTGATSGLCATLQTFNVPLSLKEGGAPSASAGFDTIWANLGTHRLQFNPNAAGTLSLVGIGSPGVSGNCAKLAANGYDILDAGATCGGSTPWSSLQAPSGNLSLAMGPNTSVFTFGATTGVNDLFKLTDTASNTGTGNLFRVSTANGSSAAPVQFDANGNGVQMNTSGVVVPKGTGGISGTAVNSGVVAPANGGTGAVSLAYGAALTNGAGAWTSLAPGANNNCMLSNGSIWLSTACPGAAGSAVVTNPANSATNNIQTLADAVPLSVSGQTAQTNDIVAFYGQVAMSLPLAPVLSQVAGGALGSSAYYAKTTCVDNLGRETTVSAESVQFTVSINNFLVVTGPITANAPLGCQGWRPYITLAGGASASETLQTVTGSQCTLATNVGASNYCAVNAAWTQTAVTTSGSAVPGSNLAKVKNFWIGADGSFNITGSLPSAPVTVFFPGNLTSTWVGAKWTPYNNITITRIQAQAKTAPVTCTPNATVRITDGTNVQTLAINAAANDSGVISQNYSSGVPLTVDISTAAAGCGTSPADVNVVLEVKLH